MNTIPASAIVSVIPSVVSAGGSGLDLNGLIMSQNTRTPVGVILAFPTALAVSDYYGGASTEYANALNYFAGFTNSNIKPGSVWFTQYNQVAVPAYVRGGSTASMTLAQLQALSGTMTITVEGVPVTSASINMATATSPSNAAAKITTGFAYFDAVTGAGSTIAAGTATNSTAASITGYTMTVGAPVTGAFVVGGLLTGTGVTAGTYIVKQLTGTTGGVGTYQVSANQTVPSTTITQTYGLLTVSTMVSGTLAVGQVISGGTTAAGTTITALGTGTGGAGTYITSGGSQTVSATTISAGPLTCTYDSTASAYVLTGGTPGTAGTIGYASGALATSLSLTAATGAVLSQGAAPAVPATFMNAIVNYTTNWASFMHNFDVDNGYGNANKLLFAAWTGLQNDEFTYVSGDGDITPTQSTAATGSLGYILKNNGTSGTQVIYDPLNVGLVAFACGIAASIDFNETNGRITYAFKSQSGMASTVTDQTTADNLIANGYNFYGSYATANQGFQFYYPGSITGPFKWADSYVNQIWLNSQFQLDLMELLTQVKSVPYDAQGSGSIRAALAPTIAQGLDFGMFAPGVDLSAAQIAEVNNAAGLNIGGTLKAQGYYLQILPASAQSRGNRTTPPLTFWYSDAGAIQQLSLASIEVQ